MEDKTILVTGGAGFIGSHLCEWLCEDNHVICVDNLVTGKKDNIKLLLKNPNFTFIEHDVSKNFKIDQSIDQIYHLSSPASPIDYQKLPIETMMVNSLGTRNMLELAKEKRAKILLASTSEVYGEPEKHPQTEEYWGHVNPTGPRSCYDESKRFAEALAMAYHRVHGVDIRIARIFNSILADQAVVVFNDSNFHLLEIGEYVNKIESEQNTERRILVPAFDKKTCRISLHEVSNVIKHPYIGDAYEIRTSYGRKVRVTGDHSVFTADKNFMPVAIPVRKLRVGDYIALPAKLPTVEKELDYVVISEELLRLCSDIELWDYAIQSDSMRNIIVKNKDKIYEILEESGKYKYGRRNFYNIFEKRFVQQSLLPLYLIKKLDVEVPPDAKLRMYKSGAHIFIPNKIKITDEILWLIGFYLAEGSSNYKDGKSYFVTFSSDDHYLDKAEKILDDNFGVHVIRRMHDKNRAPAIFVHSKILYFIFDKIFQIIKKSGNEELRIPPWVFQLPLHRLKHFLEGFREGDGTHSGKKMGEEMCFDTKYENFALDLTMLLLRFGIVASVGEYTTNFKKKYGDRKFKFYRLTICELSSFDILQWDKGVKQKLIARTKGDLVWSKVKDIKKCKPTQYVYDFSVPGAENFMAGNGVCCHNTYGPRMRSNDGRVIPNFVMQALKNEDITVYGDGKQTRSFCYISDMIDGLIRLMESGRPGEILNLGHPDERKVVDVAKMIKEMTQSNSKIIFLPLPKDDPTRRKPDIKKAKEKLGWEPKISFESGLKKTIEWFRGSL